MYSPSLNKKRGVSMDNFTLYELTCLRRLVANEVAYFSSKLDDCIALKDEIGEKFYRREVGFYHCLLYKFNKLLNMEE